MLLGNLNAEELASVLLSIKLLLLLHGPSLISSYICSYRTIQEHKGSSEWSDGVHQRWHHPGWSRLRKWSPRSKSHPLHHPRHCCGISSLPRAALQKKPPVSRLQLPQEGYSGEQTDKMSTRGELLIVVNHPANTCEGKVVNCRLCSCVCGLTFFLKWQHFFHVQSLMSHNP